MKRKNVIIFLIIFILVFSTSYFMFYSGVTEKIKGQINEATASVKKTHYISDLPVINTVINSSGKKLVNDDVAITINAESNYNIKKLEYSFDLKNWTLAYDNLNDKKINAKIIFNKTIDKKVFLRVVNEFGFTSYAYETSVRIDKNKPKLKVTKDGNDVIIEASDNFELAAIQYSNDKLNWVSEEVSGKIVKLRKEQFGYIYIRVVDKVGNISSIKGW